MQLLTNATVDSPASLTSMSVRNTIFKNNLQLIISYTRVQEFRNGSTPVLFLNAGDTYTGTPWFNIYQHEIVTDFMNLLNPDVVVS